MYEKYFKVIDENEQQIFEVSDRIFDFAEIGYDEYQSSALLEDRLEKEGFKVERGAGGIPTCFVATYGSGSPVIGIQAEYDALSGISQKPGVIKPSPVVKGGNGHGCGHNLFAAGAFAAALAIRDFLKERGTGTLRVFGCPAEEGGAGKVFMIREGLYQGTDAVVSWHPNFTNRVRTEMPLAYACVEYKFKGIAAHAGGSPEKGRSALDAAELMNVGVQFLREHMSTSARIHYAFTDEGGTAPNVVQASAAVKYMIRALDNAQVNELRRRVDLIAKGAAMMTETKLKTRLISANSNYVSNSVLQKLACETMKSIPTPQPTEEEFRLAREFQKNMNLSEKLKSLPPYLTDAKELEPVSLDTGSTDTADVSWNVPTVQMWVTTWMLGTQVHSWQAVSQGKGTFAKKGVLYAGKCVAGAVMRLFDQPETLQKAKEEFAEKTKDAYLCPIPKNVKPGM